MEIVTAGACRAPVGRAQGVTVQAMTVSNSMKRFAPISPSSAS